MAVASPCSRQIIMPAYDTSQFLQTGCPSYRPTNSVNALKAFPVFFFVQFKKVIDKSRIQNSADNFRLMITSPKSPFYTVLFRRLSISVDHLSGPGRVLGLMCIYVCVSDQLLFNRPCCVSNFCDLIMRPIFFRENLTISLSSV